MDKITTKTPSFFTQQVYLIGTRDPGGQAHFCPISWISYTWGEPNCLVISMYGVKKTKENIARTGLLSATVLTQDLMAYAECCNEDTLNPGFKTKIIPELCDGTYVDVPLIKNAKFSYECKILQTVEIGECHTYFAEIKGVHASDDVQALDFLDLTVIKPIIYSHFHYFTVGEHLGKIGDFSK